MEYPINNKGIYRTWILVVLWVLQMIVEVINIGVNAFRVRFLSYVLGFITSDNSVINTGANCVVYNYTDSYGNPQTSSSCDGDTYNGNFINLALAAAAFGLAFACIFFITHIAQIVQYSQKKLSPKANFGYEIFRFSVTTITLVLYIATTVAFGSNILTLVFTILVWILYMMSTIYASIIFHRYRKGAYNNILPVTQNASNNATYQSQTVYPNKQEANYSNGQYQRPYDSAPGVVPNPPSFRH